MFVNSYTSAPWTQGIPPRLAKTHERMSPEPGISEDGSKERDRGNIDVETSCQTMDMLPMGLRISYPVLSDLHLHSAPLRPPSHLMNYAPDERHCQMANGIHLRVVNTRQGCVSACPIIHCGLLLARETYLNQTSTDPSTSSVSENNLVSRDSFHLRP